MDIQKNMRNILLTVNTGGIIMKKQLIFSFMALAMAFGAFSSFKPADANASSAVRMTETDRLSSIYQKAHPTTVIINKTEADIELAKQSEIALYNNGFELAPPEETKVTRVTRETMITKEPRFTTITNITRPRETVITRQTWYTMNTYGPYHENIKDQFIKYNY